MNGQKVYKDSTVKTVPCPVAGITVGEAFEQGGHFGFSQETVAAADAEGKLITMDCSGIFRVTAEATADISHGSAIYFNSAAIGDAPKFGDGAGRFIGYAYAHTLGVILEAGDEGEIMVDVQICPKTTRAEAIEDAGGADA